MSNTTIAPGKVLVYKQKIDTGSMLYQYKLSDGTVGEIPTAVIEMMQIDINALPVVIDAELLIKSINNSKTKITDLVTAMAQKADIDFVKKLSQTKLSVGKFIEFIKTVALTEYVDAALENKADLSSTITALQNKADKNSVYTIDEFHRVLFQFIGAKGVRTIQERDALEYGIYPFVWVLDASSDVTPGVESPAFYKWSENHWVYIGTIGNFIGGGSGGDCNCEPVDLSEINEAIQGLQSLTNNLNTSIESHSTEINNLNNLTEAHGKSVNDLRDEIELVSGIVATNARDISENETNIAALQSVVQTHSTDVDYLKGALSKETSDRITAIDAVNARIDDIDLPEGVDLTPLEQRIAKVETEIGLSNQILTNLLNTEFAQEV